MSAAFLNEALERGVVCCACVLLHCVAVHIQSPQQQQLAADMSTRYSFDQDLIFVTEFLRDAEDKKNAVCTQIHVITMLQGIAALQQ